MINSCGNNKPQLELLAVKHLPDFPSASAIEYDNGKIYLFGDDAAYLQVLDTTFRRVNTIRYSTDTTYRISRITKPDIEAATIIKNGTGTYIIAIGSFSTPQRQKIMTFLLPGNEGYDTIHFTGLSKELQSLPEINLEGLAAVDSKLVFANRANKTHTLNKLVITNNFLFDKVIHPQTSIHDLDLKGTNIIGVSGLFYIKEKDMLLFTASEEDTPSATQDGTINDSYLGWIADFSKKTDRKTIRPDELIKLSTIHPVFEKQKIESVCVQELTKNAAVLLLAADNDNGESTVFKLNLKL